MTLNSNTTTDISRTQWYIAECKPTHERTIRTKLQKVGYEAYVASQPETHVYKSRNRRVVENILLPGRVFVHTEKDNLMDIMLTFSSIYRFQTDKARNLTERGEHPYAFVPERQMQQLQHVLGRADHPVFFTAEDLRLRQKARVTQGLLAGTEGWIYRKDDILHIAIKVETGFGNYAYTKVPPDDIQLIE